MSSEAKSGSLAPLEDKLGAPIERTSFCDERANTFFISRNIQGFPRAPLPIIIPANLLLFGNWKLPALARRDREIGNLFVISPFPITGILTLLKNYPEPFYDQTRITVQLSQPGQAQIEIVNILGQRIKQFENLPMKTGEFSIDWDGTDNRGTKVVPGLYFCVVKQDNKIAGVDRMILVK